MLDEVIWWKLRVKGPALLSCLYKLLVERPTQTSFLEILPDLVLPPRKHPVSGKQGGWLPYLLAYLFEQAPYYPLYA